MRDIKFRAWDKENLEMIKYAPFGFDSIGNFDRINHETINPINFELMQYTGHSDKNGKEIYEGDVVEQGKGILFKVVFKGDCWRAEPVNRTRSNRWLSNDLKVIGNIYENYNLLEDK